MTLDKTHEGRIYLQPRNVPAEIADYGCQPPPNA